MKIKLEIKKRCRDGELYIFKNGVATVPGMYINKAPVTITLKEFNELNGGK
jgi:hypothetical protein